MTSALFLWAWLFGVPAGMMPHQHCYHFSQGVTFQYANAVYPDPRIECRQPSRPTPPRCCWCDGEEPQPPIPPLPEHCKHAASEGHGQFYPAATPWGSIDTRGTR